MQIALRALVGVFVIAYPFAIYFGLEKFSPRVMAGVIAVLLVFRLFLLRDALKAQAMNLLLPSAMALLVVALVLVSGVGENLMLMPVMFNLGFLLVFASSLFKPVTVIEALVRLKKPQVSSFARAYMRKVTLLWCGFFLFNGAIAFYTYSLNDTQVWTLYNGFISYLLMGALFAGEFLYRLRVHRKEEQLLKQGALDYVD